MAEPEIIPLSPDTAPSEIEGTPPPPNVGNITFETDAQGNRVNLRGYKVVDGVPEGDKLEEEFNEVSTTKGE